MSEAQKGGGDCFADFFITTTSFTGYNIAPLIRPAGGRLMAFASLARLASIVRAKPKHIPDPIFFKTLRRNMSHV